MKYMNQARRAWDYSTEHVRNLGTVGKVSVGLGLLAANGAVFAQTTGTDYSSLTSAVDFTTAITAILAVFAALAGVYVVMKAGTLILSKIRR